MVKLDNMTGNMFALAEATPSGYREKGGVAISDRGK